MTPTLPGPFQGCLYGILCLNSVPQSACPAKDATRLSYQITQQIKMVRSLVHQYSPSFTCPGPTPGGQAIIVCRARPHSRHLNVLNIANVTFPDQLGGCTDFWMEAVLEDDAQEPPLTLRHLYHRIGFRNLHSHRFFYKNMTACLQALKGESGMQRMRCQNNHNIRVHLFKQLERIGVEGTA